jgi:hypothetical protein
MSSLLALEQEILAEGRDWTRRRLEERLQKEAAQIEGQARASGRPLRETRYRPLELLTVSGTVQLKVLHGYDVEAQQWICPVRQAWKLESYQRVSPELQARLCETATEVTSYEAAARVATRWGTPSSDDLVHAHVQKVGARTAEMNLPVEPVPTSEPEFSLVIMMDAWKVRERGCDWGVGPGKKNAQRVEWHDVKSAVIYRLEQRVQKGERALLAQKFVVAVPPMTEPVDFGAAVQAEALRRGLGRARRVYIVMDGAVYLWAIAQDRFAEAIKTLDFYHASQHLWAVAHAHYGENSEEARQWVEPLLHQLRHGKEIKVVRTLEALAKDYSKRSAVGRVIYREAEYFRTHEDHLHYAQRAKEGSPIGSGAVESLCSQLQNRFKNTGQFWKRPSLANLLRVAILCRNEDQNHIWN